MVVDFCVCSSQARHSFATWFLQIEMNLDSTSVGLDECPSGLTLVESESSDSTSGLTLVESESSDSASGG